MAKKIGIDQLPRYSPWVARLLNLDPFTRPQRTVAKIDAEYDKDKFARLLEFYEQNPDTGLTGLRANEEDFLPPQKELCVSRNRELFLMPAAEVQQQDRQMLLDSLRPYMARSRVVVELGCGYGYNLGVLKETAPGHRFIGGDYSPNAVRLAGRLFQGQPEITVMRFNFYDQTWPIFDAVPEKAVVFTHHAIEQLPSARAVLPVFASYRQKIEVVVHLEPVFELNDPATTLGLLRQSYILANDYNRDLFTGLKEMGVNIIKAEDDLFGPNPLDPTSLIVWQF